jgi:hypothetical protein
MLVDDETLEEYDRYIALQWTTKTAGGSVRWLQWAD